MKNAGGGTHVEKERNSAMVVFFFLLEECWRRNVCIFDQVCKRFPEIFDILLIANQCPF